jgi:hypothetical protein
MDVTNDFKRIHNIIISTCDPDLYIHIITITNQARVAVKIRMRKYLDIIKKSGDMAMYITNLH